MILKCNGSVSARVSRINSTERYQWEGLRDAQQGLRQSSQPRNRQRSRLDYTKDYLTTYKGNSERENERQRLERTRRSVEAETACGWSATLRLEMK